VKRYGNGALGVLAFVTVGLLGSLLLRDGVAYGFFCLKPCLGGSNTGARCTDDSDCPGGQCAPYCLHWTQGSATLDSFLGTPTMTLLNGTLTWDENAYNVAQDWNAAGTPFHYTVDLEGTLNEPCGSPGAAHACPNSGPVNDNPVVFRSSFCGLGFNDIVAQTNNCYDIGTGAMLNAPVFVNSTAPWNAYDGDIIFTADGEALNDIRRVVLHEFGHVLGLDHPDDHGQSVSAIMNKHESDLDRLQSDDLGGIRSLYSQSSASGSGGPAGSNINSCQLDAHGGAPRGWILWWLPAIAGVRVRRWCRKLP